MTKFGCFLFICFSRLSAAPFSCRLEVPAPAYVRPEGITELLAEVIMTCDGEVPSAGVRESIDLSSNTNISDSPLILIGDGRGRWKLGENVFSGLRTGPNQIRWEGFPLARAGDRGPLHYRFVNLRTNASALGTSVGQVHPTTIFFSVQIPHVELGSPILLAGVITPPTLGQLSSCNGHDKPEKTAFSQAEPLNTELSASGGNGDSMQFAIHFSESFEGAFKPLMVVGSRVVSDFAEPITESSEMQSIPGVHRATQGTRLMASFSNIPLGVDLYVTTEALLPGLGTSDSVRATLRGTGTMLDDLRTAKCGNVQVAVAHLPLNQGFGRAEWEIMDSDPNTIEEISFGVVLAFRSDMSLGIPGLGSAVVQTGLAPQSTITVFSPNSPVPRFIPTRTAQNFFSVIR